MRAQDIATLDKMTKGWMARVMVIDQAFGAFNEAINALENVAHKTNWPREENPIRILSERLWQVRQERRRLMDDLRSQGWELTSYGDGTTGWSHKAAPAGFPLFKAARR
jgi:hypothetical protein